MLMSLNSWKEMETLTLNIVAAIFERSRLEPTDLKSGKGYEYVIKELS